MLTQPLAERAEYTTYEPYVLADSISELAAARQHERQVAEQLLENRRSHYEQTGEVVYQPVDALSTADSVLRAEQDYGEGSSEHREHYTGLLLDCQRLVGEWYRKKKSEYFPPVRHVFDEDKEEFFSHGLSIRQMTENALTPIAHDPEEEARRINERVEDATPHLARRLGKIALGSQAIRTISECTDKAIADYNYDLVYGKTHRGYNGYVPEIQKVMIRDIRLDETTNDRFEEQLGLPGTYITHEIIQLALARRGADVSTMDKTELHGSQLIVQDSLMDFVALLDDVAGEQWCTNIFMGEEVTPGTTKNYEKFREEALARQERLTDLAETTAQFVLDLARSSYDRTKAPGHVESFVKKLLLDVAKQDVAVAEQMFDKRTADGLQQVAFLESAGRAQEAFELLQTVEKQAPGGGFCGAGSCGLEGVNMDSKEGQGLLKKLGADSGDTIVKDTERACRCGKKSIVYAYNKNKVTKYCESCGSFESKASKA